MRPSNRSRGSSVCALAASTVLVADVLLASAFPAHAEEAPTGIPDPSIATSLPPELADPGGIRRDLAARGITVGANYIGEYFGVASGGLNRDGHYDGRLELYLDANLERWSGGRASPST